MLKYLQIENYALIEKLEIEFGDGLTVITGETGAGKSILLGALSLILGQRADTQVLRDSKKKCIIEGHFFVRKDSVQSLFDQYQLDFEEVSIFRREITPQGKSRAFINDTPINLQGLKEVSERIIDIHSQHQNLLLGEASFQIDVIDNYADITNEVDTFSKAYALWNKKKIQIQTLEKQEQQAKTDLDYYQFQVDELQKTELDAAAYVQWETELEMIRHAEEINQKLEATHFLLAGDEANVIGRLHQCLQQIKSLSSYSADFKAIDERLDSLLIEIKDIDKDVESLSENAAFNPQRADELEGKLDSVNKLLLKHHVSDVQALISVRDSYVEKISSVRSMEELIESEKKELGILEKRLQQQAAYISEKRGKSIPVIEKEILGLLKQLGMPAATLKIEQDDSGEMKASGTDRIRFLFSANPGADLREISKVASGGELSRLMLCIKSMVSRKNVLPGIIFDEIDTGISGEIGGKIGDIMKQMALDMQVIAITHLPQIAARADRHLLVYKTVKNGKTQTHIRSLEKSEQIIQIARMLGGEDPSPGMIKTAEELINQRQLS